MRADAARRWLYPGKQDVSNYDAVALSPFAWLEFLNNARCGPGSTQEQGEVEHWFTPFGTSCLSTLWFKIGFSWFDVEILLKKYMEF